jgi:NADH-quinone oxidoreductase subunit G
MPVANRVVARPSALAGSLASLPAAIADDLKAAGRKAILIGQYAQQHPDFAAILAAAQELARQTGATVGILPDGANAVGAHLAGAVPASGLDAKAMLASPRKAYLLAGLDAGRVGSPGTAKALAGAEFVVALSAYRSGSVEHAHVVLPIVPFTETGGTFVSMEGRVQGFNAVVKPLGEARPAWKVLKMLGDLLKLPGFGGETLDAIRAGIAPDLAQWARSGLGNAVSGSFPAKAAASGLERIAEVPAYAGDPIARRSPPLQKTADAKRALTARISAATFASLGLAQGDRLRVRQGGGETILAAAVDAAVPDGCVRIARGIPETAALGSGEVSLEKVPAQVAA